MTTLMAQLKWIFKSCMDINYKLPGKNCTGSVNDVQTAPEVFGRKKEVDGTASLTWNSGRTTQATLFNLTCAGGCITVVSVGLLCNIIFFINFVFQEVHELKFIKRRLSSIISEFNVILHAFFFMK